MFGLKVYNFKWLQRKSIKFSTLFSLELPIQLTDKLFIRRCSTFSIESFVRSAITLNGIVRSSDGRLQATTISLVGMKIKKDIKYTSTGDNIDNLIKLYT